MTDEDIVNAFTIKHDMTIMPGPFRDQHVDLVRMAREFERETIVAWWQANNIDWCNCGHKIEAGEHLK